MPTLEFEGKPFVYSHHHSVAFHEINAIAGKSVGKGSLDSNLVIHGDNLAALKSLLPRYAGKVDVVYIDPPYNTGKEGWAYNDRVNSPLMKQWLQDTLRGGTVDTNDLQRHDKWLCMMWPRIEIIKELLSDRGVLFCSIDDNEMHNLRSLLNEQFGDKNFLGQVSVLVNPKGRGLKDSDFAKTHEYIVCYQRAERETSLGERKSDAKVEKEYKHRDANGHRYRLLELRNTHREFGKHNRENLWYPLYAGPVGEDGQGPVSLQPQPGFEEVYPFWDDGYEGCWTWDAKKSRRDINLLRTQLIKGKLKIFRMGYATTDTGEAVQQKIKTIWNERDFYSETGASDLVEIIPDAKFQTPKPVALIKQLLTLVDRDDFLVLDSFAGSGTTGQAVLSLNAQDGGSRRFILVESEDYADHLTAERLRRAIRGVKGAADPLLKAGLAGEFTYCDLGQAMSTEQFFGESGHPSYEQVARYVTYTATGETPSAPTTPAPDFFVAEVGGRRIHVIYEPDLAFLRSADAALTLERANVIASAAGALGKEALVFGAAVFVNSKELRRLGVTFAQLPWSIHERLIGDGGSK